MGLEKVRKSILLGPLLFDIAACLLLCLLFIGIPELSLQPYQRGFFCNDESIRLPYKDDTISAGLLFLILLVIPIGIVVPVEVYRDFRLRKIDPDVYSIRTFGINRIIVRACTYLGYCFIGLCFEHVICETTKLAVGRLRPHFIDVCQPNVGWLSCVPPYIYITNYTCTSTFSDHLKREAHVSFFSGHTATTMHVVTYCVIYLYFRLPRRIYGVTLLPIAQIILITAGLLVGYSRISDHKHHWSDVLVGAIVGVFTGSLTAIYLARLFQRQKFLTRNDQKMLMVDGNDISYQNNSNSSRALSAHRPSTVLPAEPTIGVNCHSRGTANNDPQVRFLPNSTMDNNIDRSSGRLSYPVLNNNDPSVTVISPNPDFRDDYTKTHQIVIN